MRVAQIFIYAPLLFINAWHILLLTCLGKAKSISESALVSHKVLVIHRIVHIIGAVCFIVYAVAIARNPDFYVTALLLICAAALDTMQVLTLNTSTDHTPMKLSDKHQFMAWVMAALYFLFALAFAITAHVPIIIIICFVLFLLLVFGFSRAKRFSNFACMQMLFFLTVSAIVAASSLVRIA